MIIDLTPIHDQTGPARLLDLVEGRSASALASWLAADPPTSPTPFRSIAMDGFAGYKTAATEVIPTRSPSWTPSMSWRWPAPNST